MGNQAIGAILDTLISISKTAAAPVTKDIQRAIAEQAAKGFRTRPRMAGKILTFSVLKKIVVRYNGIPLFIIAIFNSVLYNNPGGEWLENPHRCRRMSCG